jgi:hypothetical protein
LPDFSWYNIPKLENIPNNRQLFIPSGHTIYQIKIDQMAK